MQYYFITYLRKLWLVPLALLVVYGLVLFFKGGPIKPKDLAAHHYHLVKGKVLLYYAMVAVFIVNVWANNEQIPFKANATISLNYDGASRGLNPNSTRFNQADMLSDVVLERVIRLGHLEDISIKDLEEVIDIVPEERKASSGSDDNYRVSTEYTVIYNANKKFAQQDGEAILELFCGSYKEWMTTEYSYSLDSLETGMERINQEDYLDMCDYFDRLADRIYAYMRSMEEKDASFKLSSTGDTFRSIATRASNVKSSINENLRSYVLDNGISKDSGTHTCRLVIKSVMQTFEARKDEKSNENRLAAIAKYEDDMATIVLVPTYDLDGQFYMSQTRIGIDNFAEQAEDYATKKTTTNADIARNSYIYQQLNDAVYTELNLQKAEELAQIVEKELCDIASLAKAIIKEYNLKKVSDYLSIYVESKDAQIRNAIKNAAAKTFILYVVALVVIFIAEIRKEKRIASLAAAFVNDIKKRPVDEGGDSK